MSKATTKTARRKPRPRLVLARLVLVVIALVAVWGAGFGLSVWNLDKDTASLAAKNYTKTTDVRANTHALPIKDCRRFEDFTLNLRVFSRKSQGRLKRKVVVYFPGWGATRPDNNRALTKLADKGYVVVALLDVRTWPLKQSADSLVRNAIAADFDLSTFVSRAAFQSIADRRTQVAAEAGACVLDHLKTRWTALSQSYNLDVTQFGLLGFSFGGAVAAELSVTRVDVAATVNLDGWIYGLAYASERLAPFLWVHSTSVPIPVPTVLGGLAPVRHFVAKFEEETQRRVSDWSRSNGFFNLYINGTNHGDLSDDLFRPKRWTDWRPWRDVPMSSGNVSEIMDGYLGEFFQTYLPTSAEEADDAAIGLLTSRIPVFKRTRIRPLLGSDSIKHQASGSQ